MVKEIRLYIEGDDKQRGKNNAIALREGFHSFFSELIERARATNTRFQLIMGNSKYETFKDFLNGVEAHSESATFFVLDSDGELNEGETARAFLQRQNGDWRLQGVGDDQPHLMIQVMESWFLADKDALERFYGQGFRRNALPNNPNVEKIAKSDVENGLVSATKNTQKGEYHKTRHGPKILQLVNADKVRESAPNCERLFSVILGLLN